MRDTMSVRTVDLHGRSFAYRQAGTGPLVVLVHGLAGTMGTWNAVVDELATRCTVVAVDLPGHGRSEPVPGDSSIGTYANAFVTCWTSWDTGRRPSSGILWEEVSRCSSRTSIRNGVSASSWSPAVVWASRSAAYSGGCAPRRRPPARPRGAPSPHRSRQDDRPSGSHGWGSTHPRVARVGPRLRHPRPRREP